METPRFLDVDGFKLSLAFDADIYRASRKYKPKEGQVVVASFPKCGTTWTLQIVVLILRKGMPPADALEYFSLMPYLEMTPLTILKNLPKGACIKTHLLFDQTTFSSKAKYIYVARHPADCIVSFYHHLRYFPHYFFSNGKLDDFFELFITGENVYGDYFDNLLSWYEQRNKPNVLFITYEALKSDTRGMILKIGKFLGGDFYENLVAEDEKVLKDVMQYSSFDFMRNTVDKYWEEFLLNFSSKEVQAMKSIMKIHSQIFVEASEAGHHSIGNFVRKGEVGEGKVILSEQQWERLEARIQEKCGHSDVMNLWKKTNTVVV